MSAPFVPTLSLWQKLDLIRALLQCVSGTFLTAILAPFRGENTAPTFKRHVLLSLMRRVFGRLSTSQQQFLTGSTEVQYDAWMATKNLSPERVTLMYGMTKAFWIGSKNSDTIVLHIHGGGWTVPAGHGHFSFADSICALANSRGKSIGILFLQYDLAPYAQYPHQLRQTVEVLRYATTELEKQPSQIILVGDSAGANLAMGLLSHLSHPHPEIAPLHLSGPLKGAVVISPILEFEMSGETFAKNNLQDPADAKTLKKWTANYQGPAPDDNYNQPGRAPAAWWKDLQVRDLLITCAAKESMVEDIRAFGEKIKSVHSETTLFSAATDFHAEPVVGRDFGLEESQQAKLIRDWVINKL